MRTVLETDEFGVLRIPASILPEAAPHTRYVASVLGNQIVLAQSGTTEAFWKSASPEERAADILRWAASHPDGPGLPDTAVGRDAIYD